MFLGVEILNKAINKLTSKGGTWRTILIEISVSNIRITDCTVSRCLLISRKVCLSAFSYCEAKKTVDARNIRITDCMVRRCPLISRKVCFSEFSYCEAKKTGFRCQKYFGMFIVFENHSSMVGGVKPQAVHKGNYFCGLMLPLIGHRTKTHFQK